MLDLNFNLVRECYNNLFFDKLGGDIYSTEIFDSNGCGSVLFELSLLSFPKLLNLNKDGINDYGQIKGRGKYF